MTTRTAERIDEWESRPFEGGYAALQDLADASFSGVVTAGRATACLLNGTVVGILDGSIEDFEDASGTIRTAPSPALPLLIVMQDRGDTVRAKYYSEETPLSEADRKLSDGGFTGYVELSENILSGDYYVVYHGGRSMSVAFVGQSDQLLTEDEAFERADDEVGIYKVYPVEIEPIEIPEPEEPEEPEPEDVPATATAVDSEDEPAAGDAETTASSGPEPSTGVENGTDDETDQVPEGDAEPAEGDDVTGGVARRDDAGVEPDDSGGREATDRSDARDSTTTETDRSRTAERPDRSTEERSQGTERPPQSETDRSEREEAAQQPAGEDRATDPQQTDTQRASDTQPQNERQSSNGGPQQRTERAGDQSATPRREEEVDDGDPLSGDPLSDAPEPASTSDDLEHRTIPSVDPSQTWTGDEDGPTTSTAAPSGAEADIGQQIDSATQSTRAGGEHPTTDTHQGNRTGEQSAELSAELEAKAETIDALEAELADIEAERDQLLAENDELDAELHAVREERDELQAEVERLRSRIEELEADEADDEVVDADMQLSSTEAIEKTNLFVRYGSKGDATLEAAHDGKADQDEVVENLDLEYHTSFDAATAAVDDEPFETFLTETIQYRFVHWVVHNLLYEVRDTGHAKKLRDLYDALPKLDRAELNGAVSVTYTENGEEQRTQEPFDIVLRDRMGNPIAVANINDSREAATDRMMTDLVTRSTRAGESHDTLAGAFFVTASFFDPDALETASEATGGGLLSRDKRESYVRLDRKQGYHLCLVEAREGKFHLAVPEL